MSRYKARVARLESRYRASAVHVLAQNDRTGTWELDGQPVTDQQAGEIAGRERGGTLVIIRDEEAVGFALHGPSIRIERSYGIQ